MSPLAASLGAWWSRLSSAGSDDASFSALRTVRSTSRAWILLFLLLVLVGAGAGWYAVRATPEFTREAVIRTGVANDLLTGDPRGRQGLIGSLYWAPLPTLLAMPLIRLPAPFGGEWAFVVMAILAAAFLCTFMAAWLRRTGLPALVAAAMALAVFCSPPVLQPLLQGSSAPLFGLLTMAAVIFLLHWWETGELRSLAYLSLTLMLVILTRYQGAMLFLIALAFVLLHLVLSRKRAHYAEATLTVFAVPPLYAVATWAIANWLIMGDPIYFARGLAVNRETWADWLSILTDGCDWPCALCLALLPLLGWLVAWLLPQQRALWTRLPVLAAALLLWSGKVECASLRVTPADRELPQVAAYLNAAHQGDWIVVAGYRGYEVAPLMSASGGAGLQRSLSFYLDQVLERTHSRRVFLLIPEPQGADRWEDVNMRYPDLFETDATFTSHEKSWPHWRLVRIVRLDAADLSDLIFRDAR